MKGYKKILVALDDSEGADEVFTEAIKVAKEHPAAVFVAYIENQLISFRSKAFLITELKKLATVKLQKKIVEAHVLGVKNIEGLVAFGDPKTYLAKVIPAEYEIDLIIMGVTKVGKLAQFLGGSTMDYVVKHAPCPVLVVKSCR